MSCLVKSCFSFATIQVVGGAAAAAAAAEKGGYALPVPSGGCEKVV